VGLWTTQERCPQAPHAQQQQQKRTFDVLQTADIFTRSRQGLAGGSIVPTLGGKSGKFPCRCADEQSLIDGGSTGPGTGIAKLAVPQTARYGAATVPLDTPPRTLYLAKWDRSNCARRRLPRGFFVWVPTVATARGLFLCCSCREHRICDFAGKYTFGESK
jgi:hypothetical protein